VYNDRWFRSPFPLPGGERPGEDRSGGNEMSSLEHPGWGRSIPPEFAILALVAASVVGLALAWPWVW